MRRQSPEWLDCSKASRPQDVPVREAAAAQHSLSVTACTSSAEGASRAHEHGDQTLSGTCESPERVLQSASRIEAAAQDGVLRSGAGSDAAVEETDAEQPEVLAADIPDEEARQTQDPSSATQAVSEEVSAASAPSRPVLAPSLLPAPAASRAQTAGEVQPSVVSSHVTCPEVPSPTCAVDLSEDAASAMEALLSLANVEGLQAPEAQAAACVESEDADASLCPEAPACQETPAAEQGPEAQPAAADHGAAMPATCDSYEGRRQCLDLVQACRRPQHCGRMSPDALRSSMVPCGGSGNERGACVPVRACNVTLLCPDTLADLAALAPSAWQRAHSMKLNVPPCRAPPPPLGDASAPGPSQMPQTVPKVPGTGQQTGNQQLRNRQHAPKLTPSPQATCRREGRAKSASRGLQRAAKQELPAAAASEAASLAGLPQRQMNKELAMLQAEGVRAAVCRLSSVHAHHPVHAEHL